MVERTIDQQRPAWPRRSVGRDLEVRQARLALLAIAAWVCVCDLLVKVTEPTKAGLYHQRTHFELAIILTITIALAYVAPLVRSRTIVAGAGLMVGGGLGNALSIVIFTQGVPNPLTISHGGWTIALNLADIGVVLGFVLATAGVARFAPEMRDELRRPISR